MITSVKPFIYVSDFEPHVFIAPNIEDEIINPNIIAVQNERMQSVIGEALYEDLMRLYERTATVLHVAVGATTDLTLSDVSHLSIGYYISLQGIEGTAGDVLNNRFHVVTGISANIVSLDVDTTGLVYEGGGLAENFLSPAYNTLRKHIIPYMAHLVYVRFASTGAIRATNSGFREKTTSQTKPATDEQISYAIKPHKESADMQRNALIDFLKNNKEDYPLFNSGEAPAPIPIGQRTCGIRPNKGYRF